MLLILFVMIPVGIYIARYGKRADLWLGWHKFFMSFALGEFAFTLRHIAVSYDEFILKMHTYDHIKIGVATACVGIAGGTVGFLAQKDWRIFARYSQGMRSVHKLGSYLTYVLGILNGWYGVQDLAASYGSTSKIWPSLYLGYFGLLVVILLGIKSIQAYLGDFANRFLDRFLQSRLGKWVERNTEENVGVVQFTEDVQIKEPAREITLEDFEQSCMDGKPWILIGGLVMDLNGYFDQHPGGRRLLEDYVGMDATNAFLGKVKNGGIHMHSRFAMNKLSSLVIACLPKEKVTEMGRSILSVSAAPPALARRRSSIVPAAIQEASTSFEAKKGPYKPTKSGLGPKIIASAALSQPLLPPSDTGPRKFILSPPSTTSETSHTSLNTSASRGAGATLVEKTTVTAFNAPMPVRKFRFRLKQTIPVDIEPGDAVTLRLRDKSGTIHIREYTPIKSPNDDCIDLYIKIYPAGLVTAPLDEVAVGDLVDMTNPESHIVTPLIHPDSEDGCYPNVVMIAAGTGITPMLQILDFYRQFGQRNSQPEQRVRASTPTSARKGLLRSHLRLLWSNRSEEEMFLITELACMERAEQGSLRVSHILSSPSASWTGSKGRVTRQHIKEILPEDLKTLLDRKLPSVDGTADLEGGNLGRCNWVNEYPWDSLCIVVCGPPGFNTAVAEILESFHVPDNVLHVL
ncbi:uncharacterized protein EV422DRAFT_274057 [Fimicolochytrium jonesii]|uniref:uncharacterized protein n=1 Tax=Fimicolochytrium jonesii TaxID=1396493 RepID=UPI0022FE5AF0|nr:uncharacterized protein EV422DRAFT_274057 [Fimicolochytrium jonesii]KAI8816890.1 hypothetical protein EV422DRAFT_274057 [Fimicolochytrium jonesii]